MYNYFSFADTKYKENDERKSLNNCNQTQYMENSKLLNKLDRKILKYTYVVAN